MGLQPLEFSDCLTDSPYFREKLHTHEKELERTNKAIKGLIAECRDLITAARELSKAQRKISQTLQSFKFDCIGSDQTEDEIVIETSLKEFGKLISAIEDERDRLLDKATDTIIRPLESFRKDQIGGAREGKKKFDKETTKFCQGLDRNLAMKTKMGEDLLKEADNQLEFEKQNFYRESMKYVKLLQEVQERKKFEFVELLLTFMYSWLTFYHQGYEASEDFTPYMQDLQYKLQKTRDNFEIYQKESTNLMDKMLEVRGPIVSVQKPDKNAHNKSSREGYLYLMEKKALGTTWSKNYCMYQKENHIFTMIPFSQTTSKGVSGMTTDTMVVTCCTRRAQDTIEKRFCFDITVQDKNQILTLQALSEEDRRQWMDSMDGKEPIYNQPAIGNREDKSLLDDIGNNFITKCIAVVENRGLDEQGLYRMVGVSSKVTKLTNMGLDRRKSEKLQLDNDAEWETKTVTSAIKNYFRSLPEPLLTFKMHEDFIQAAKKESRTLRINEVHELIYKLPEPNFEMLEILIAHLQRVSQSHQTNLMTIANLGVCFGPTLMRSPEETMSSIMDIKWCNLVVEVLIDNYDTIFKLQPQCPDLQNVRILPSTTTPYSSPVKSVISCHAPSRVTNTQSQFSNAMSTPPPPPPHNAVANTSRESTPSYARHHSFSSSPNSHGSATSSVMTTSMPSAQIYANLAENAAAVNNNTSPGGSSSGGGGSSAGSMAQSFDQSQTTYAAARAKLRPTGGFYSQYSGDMLSSASSSTESLNSKCSNTSAQPPPPNLDGNQRRHSGSNSAASSHPVPVPPRLHGQHLNTSSSALAAATNTPNKGETGNGDGGTSCGGHKKRKSADSLTFSISSSTSSVSSLSSGPNSRPGRKVRTLYACEAENDAELSFEPNQIIYNVKQSREPGWLEGSMDGNTGLLPANYVQFLD